MVPQVGTKESQFILQRWQGDVGNGIVKLRHHLSRGDDEKKRSERGASFSEARHRSIRSERGQLPNGRFPRSSPNPGSPLSDSTLPFSLDWA